MQPEMKGFAGPIPEIASAYITSDEFLDFNMNYGFQIIITKHVFLCMPSRRKGLVLVGIFSMLKISRPKKSRTKESRKRNNKC